MHLIQAVHKDILDHFTSGLVDLQRLLPKGGLCHIVL